MSFYNGILNHDDESGSVNIKGARGAPGIGFKLDLNNDYDMQNKKLVNVKQGTNNNDVITKSQLDIKTSLLDGSRPSYVVNDKAAIYSSTGALHAQSLYLKDTPDNAGNYDEIRIMTEHQSRSNVHLNIPDIQNFDGYGGRPKSEFMITSVDQNVTGKKVFENIEVHDPTSNNQATNKHYVDFKIANNDQFVKKTGDVLTGDLILPHDNYPVQGNTNKAVSYETQREIFLSRKESFPMQAEINMNNNFIQNVATPTTSHQGANKGYCDYNFLNRQKGGVIMGPLSMNRNDLIGIPDTPKFGSSAVNKSYVEGEIAKIPQGSNSDTSSFLKLDGSRVMSGNLDMDNHKIVKLQDPTEDTDVVNKQYLENKLIESHLQPSGPSNIFHFLMNDTSKFSSIREIIIGSFSDVEKVAHRLNKKALSILLQNDLQTVSYSARLGLDMTSLSVGDYTLVMEFYWPEKFNIYTYADSTPTNIVDEQNIKNFSNYQKLYLQFTKKNTNSPNNLIMEIRGELSTSNQQTGYLIFYGTKGTHYSITNDFYDQYIMSDIFIYNGNMKMQTKIDMNNNKIIKLSNGTDPDDAVNKGQLDSVKNHSEMVKNQLDSYLFYMKNYLYMSIFTHRFYDLKEPIKFILDGSAISSINPNMSIISSGSSHITVSGFDPIRGLQFNPSTKIIIDLGYMVNQNSPYTIMISLTLKDHLRLYFIEPIHEQTVYFPAYVCNPSISTISLRINNLLHDQIYPSVLNNKQTMLWIYYNPSETKYEIIIGNGNYLNLISPPISNFSTNKLRIDANNNIINKICYQNQHFASAETFTKMMFEERKNGSYF